MQLLGFSEEMLDILAEIDESCQNPDEEREEHCFQENQKLREMLSEGNLGQESYDPKDDIGIACQYLECIREGEETIL